MPRPTKRDTQLRESPQDHCDYTFDTLKENMPKALASVDVSTVQKWEHWMFHWMDGYRDGLDAKAAQLEVRQNSSCKYSSHHRVQETVAQINHVIFP